MLHNSLKHSGHWGCSESASSGILLQLGDHHGEQVRVKLTADEAEQIAEQLWFMASKERKNPGDYQQKLFQRVYGRAAGLKLHKLMSLPTRHRKLAVEALDYKLGKRLTGTKIAEVYKKFQQHKILT